MNANRIVVAMPAPRATTGGTRTRGTRSRTVSVSSTSRCRPSRRWVRTRRSHSSARRSVASLNASWCVTRRSTYRSTPLLSANVRTPTTSTDNVRIGGISAARAIRCEASAVSAMPATVASTPSPAPFHGTGRRFGRSCWVSSVTTLANVSSSAASFSRCEARTTAAVALALLIALSTLRLVTGSRCAVGSSSNNTVAP